MDNQVNKAIDVLLSEEDEPLFSNPMVFDDEWLDEHVRGLWTRRADGKIDVDGSLTISSFPQLDQLPFQFGKVTGTFDCSYNGLTDLAGAPEEVELWFHCEDNKLTSLNGAPRKIGASFNCSSNALDTLEGGPEWVGGNFTCYNNSLYSLDGAPFHIGNKFDADEFHDTDYRLYVEQNYE